MTIGCEDLVREGKAPMRGAFAGALFESAILSVLVITLSPPPLSSDIVTHGCVIFTTRRGKSVKS
ncbi:hypothetical protein BCAR13_800002 [Paraburkholderia caribensis]|nr:hypothetical protein BCAR13_800002 [Paraburkholderia caribensis]